MLKHIRALKSYAESIGLQFEAVPTKKGHIRCVATRSDGATYLLFVGSSPSCARAEKNNHSLLSRFATHQGADTDVKR